MESFSPTFHSPTILVQDLLFIQDILQPDEKEGQPAEDDINSSGDEASEAEIHADLVEVEEEDSDSESSVETSSSEASESEDEDEKINLKDLDDEGESGTAAPPATSYFQTKNELLESHITVPDMEQVAPEELLEPVGQVFSIMDKTVIIKGASMSSHALDSDTLLVFDDRKVLGYIYETFGPTTQPLYQVKFSSNYPIDPEKIKLSRAVFHVPQRSKFVVVDQIRRFRGSDASNVHDEEPADYELDFSDDEAEAEHKRRRRLTNSVASSSRAGTPSPAQMRDQDMSGYETNPYADNSAYDDNYGAGPSSRPAPMPYDDPYADDYSTVASEAPSSTPSHGRDWEFARARGRGRGGRGQRRGRERGRGGGGAGRGWVDGRGTQRFDDRRGSQPRSNSPTSMAIARATGQYSDAFASTPTAPTWPAVDPSQFNFGPPSNGFVQPHINPRFASAFGFGVVPQAPQAPPYYYQQPDNSWWNGPGHT
ncbi:NAF1-domain-containing protein [Mycena amicta]|nr:NAF1-domain-containing protein [Mycena amicta]